MPREDVENRIYSIPVPEGLDEQVRARMRAGGFGSLSEYVRSVIREDLERAGADQLEKKLLRAIERSDFREVTPEFWENLRSAAREGRRRKG